MVSAQLEGGSYSLNKEELDFSQVVTDSIKEYSGRFPNRELHNTLEPGLIIQGDPLLIQILVNNLIENAVKYSPAGTPISVVLKKQGGLGIFEVRDEGNGIPRKEHKRIFQKFYRVGNEYTRTTQGTGLGLYLSRKITQDHNMRLYVSDNIPRGSIFTVRFNLSPS